MEQAINTLNVEDSNSSAAPVVTATIKQTPAVMKNINSVINLSVLSGSIVYVPFSF